MPNKKGRPLKLTPEITEIICNSIKQGDYTETAAAMAGIHKDTLYEWLKKGNRAQRKSIYRDFTDAVKKAQAERESLSVRVITLASKNQWQAAAWKLERQNPDRWGLRNRTEVTIKGLTPEREKELKDIFDSVNKEDDLDT